SQRSRRFLHPDIEFQQSMFGCSLPFSTLPPPPPENIGLAWLARARSRNLPFCPRLCPPLFQYLVARTPDWLRGKCVGWVACFPFPIQPALHKDNVGKR